MTDGRGNVTELHQYQGSGPSGPADVTHYTFTPAGSLKTVTDPLGNVWTYHYNLRQLKESVDDPDSGTRTFTYDAVGQVTSTTDANQAKTSYRYDKIGRKTEMWQETWTAAPSWRLGCTTARATRASSTTASASSPVRAISRST
ncbi:hypothetical protein ACFQZ4_48090 [Catellatospora coxensis]